MIERFGERILSIAQRMQGEDEPMNEDGVQHRQGLKRKFEDPLEFDENGNWTLETARAKLQDFFAINGKDLQFDEKEVGTLQDRHYQVK